MKAVLIIASLVAFFAVAQATKSDAAAITTKVGSSIVGSTTQP